MSLDPISADLAVPLQTFTNKAFTHSTYTMKTSIEYKPRGYDIYTRAIPTTRAGHKSPSGSEPVTTDFFHTSINQRSMVSHPLTPEFIGHNKTLSGRHLQVITNSPYIN